MATKVNVGKSKGKQNRSLVLISNIQVNKIDLIFYINAKLS